MDNGLEDQRKVNRELLKLAEGLGVKTVATNDVHYLEKGDAEYHDALLCIQTGKLINETKRLKFIRITELVKRQSKLLEDHEKIQESRTENWSQLMDCIVSIRAQIGDEDDLNGLEAELLERIEEFEDAEPSEMPSIVNFWL